MSKVLFKTNNVIYADFTTGWRKATIELMEQCNLKNDYLQMCAAVLDEDDYMDLIDAIVDHEFYDESDPEIKQLADKYFENQL